MAVVINDFEVLPEPQAAAHSSGGEAQSEASAPEKIEPCAVASAMRTLDVQALRAWAH